MSASSLAEQLARFLESHADLADAYALAIVLSAEGHSVTFALADTASMEAKLDAQYPDVRPTWEDQFWGTRWNPGDFPHMQTVEISAGLDDALDALERVDIDLDTTPEFVAFVALFDQSEAERKEWMRHTIPPELFARLFPELVAFERFLDDAAEMSTDEQAAFWAAAMEELALKTNTPRTAQLRKLGRTEYDAHDALVALGQPAIGPLLRIVERYAKHPPFNEQGTMAFQIHGALSAESKLTTAAMFGLRELGDVGDDAIARLRHVLRELVADYPDEGTVGVAAAVAARVLHGVDPDTFPEADVDPETNRLRNHDAF